MTDALLYASLARMLDYPEEKESLLSAHGAVQGYLDAERPECSSGPFAEFVAGSTLAEIQEEYVTTFDFSPVVAPYLGHHLFGDHQKKGEYLITLKQEYRQHGHTPPGNELPDHLPVILRFLAHLADQGKAGALKSFIDRKVLPGVEKLSGSFTSSRQNSPWRPVVEAARLICSADCIQGRHPTESIGDDVPDNSRLKTVAPTEASPC